MSAFYIHPVARFTQAPTVICPQERLVWEALPEARKWSPRFWNRTVADADAVTPSGLQTQVGEEQLAAEVHDLSPVNSLFSRESVLRTYGMDAEVFYLGIDTEHFSL